MCRSAALPVLPRTIDRRSMLVHIAADAGDTQEKFTPFISLRRERERERERELKGTTCNGYPYKLEERGGGQRSNVMLGKTELFQGPMVAMIASTCTKWVAATIQMISLTSSPS